MRWFHAMVLSWAMGLCSLGWGRDYGMAEPAPEVPENSADKIEPVRRDAAGDPLPRSAISRLGTLRWAHGTEVDFATYLHDGRQVLTVDQDGLFRVWDTPTGRLLRQFGKGDCKELYWFVYHANAKSRVIEVVGSPNSHHVIALSSAGETVAISHGDGNVSLWDIATGKIRLTIEANVATTLAFAPDGQSLFSRGLDQLVRQYDVHAGKEIRTFGGAHSDGKLIYCNDAGGLMVSADNKTVFSIHVERQDGQEQVSVRSWEIATGKELPVLKGKKPMKGFASVAFSLQAKLVALCDQNGAIHVWDLVAAREVHHLAGPIPEGCGYSAAIAFSPDGKQLVSRSSFRSMQLWDTVEGKELRQFHLPKDHSSNLYTGNLAFSPDGLRIVSAGRAGTVRQLETRSGKEVELPVSRHCGLVETLALSPDGKTVVTHSHDHTLHLWKADDGTEIKQVQLPSRIDQASFSEDGKILALAGYDSKLHLRIWDAVHLEGLRKWEVSSEIDGRDTPFALQAGPLGLSANGKRLAVRHPDGTTKLWEVGAEEEEYVKPVRRAFETGNEHHFFRGQKLTLSRDGTLLADLASEKDGQISLRLWELSTGKLITMFDVPQPSIRAFAFSPDGRTLATVDADRSISLWEVASGKQRTRLGRARPGESAPDQAEIARTSMMGDLLRSRELMCIAFSPDAKQLAAGDSSGRVRRFDVTTSKELATLEGHLGPVVSLAFGTNGKRLVSGSTDTTALVWDVGLLPSEIVPMRSLNNKELEKLWQDLSSADTTKAHQAIRVLCKFPKGVVPFFQARLRPVEVDQKQLARWIGDLDSDMFAARESATEELRKLGEIAEDAIQKALGARPALEAQARLEALLAGPRMCATQPPVMLRALEVLEDIGTTEAQQVVRTLAQGAVVARITRDAQDTLKRMVDNPK